MRAQPGTHAPRAGIRAGAVAIAAVMTLSACSSSDDRSPEAFCDAATSSLDDIRADLEERNEIYRSNPDDLGGNFANMAGGIIELQENVLALYRNLDKHAPDAIQPDTSRAAELYADLIEQSGKAETSILGALASLGEMMTGALRTTNATDAVDEYAESVCGFNITARMLEA